MYAALQASIPNHFIWICHPHPFGIAAKLPPLILLVMKYGNTILYFNLQWNKSSPVGYRGNTALRICYQQRLLQGSTKIARGLPIVADWSWHRVLILWSFRSGLAPQCRLAESTRPSALTGREVPGGRRDEGAASILTAGCPSCGSTPWHWLADRGGTRGQPPSSLLPC